MRRRTGSKRVKGVRGRRAMTRKKASWPRRRAAQMMRRVVRGEREGERGCW
jgi:hypothetical protein